jgi:hypothetical protein
VDHITTTRAWHPDAAVAVLASAQGTDLVGLLDDIDPQRLDARGRVTYLQATERAIAWLTSLQSDALVACAGRFAQRDEHEITSSRVVTIEDASRSEVAAATRWSESWAHDRICTSRLLAGPLIATRRSLAKGAITARHADAIAAAVQRLAGYGDWLDGPDDPHRDVRAVGRFLTRCLKLEVAALKIAERRSVAATRKAAERSLVRLDAEYSRRRRETELRHRDVYVVPEPDGMAMLIARLGIEQAQACLSAVTAVSVDPLLPLSAGTPDDAGVGERRAEALVHLLLGGAGAQQTPVRTHVDVVISLDALVGVTEEPGTISGKGPGGPEVVPAELVRALVAADPSATMRRLVTDPLTGHLLDRGRATYAVPDALRAFIVTRDGSCRFPGCGRRAALTQLDHARPWDDGGPTDRANLGALCVRHHQLKTHAGWSITASRADGAAQWRSPAGLIYEHAPPRLLSRE